MEIRKEAFVDESGSFRTTMAIIDTNIGSGR